MNVLIQKSVCKVNQSGFSREQWSIIFPTKHDSEFLNPITGWTSSSDMMQELNLKFSTKESAIDFVNSKGWSFEEVEYKKRKIIKKSYADNFIDKS